MEPITFELLDGYKDPEGTVHKTVVMHHITMEEQVKLKGSPTIIALEKSNRSLSSKNPATQLLALTEYQEYHLELLKLVVDSIGNVERGPILGAVLPKLTARDISLMIGYHKSGSSLLIPLELVLEALNEVGVASAVQTAFVQRIKLAMGETSELTEPSEN